MMCPRPQALGVLASLRDQHILTQRRKVAKRITKATPWQFSFFQRGGQASRDRVLCTSDCLLGVLASLRDNRILTQRRKVAKRITKATPWQFSFFQRGGQASRDHVLYTSDCLNNTTMTRQHCQITGGWPHLPRFHPVSPPFPPCRWMAPFFHKVVHLSAVAGTSTPEEIIRQLRFYKTRLWRHG
jgi:hypothetical protein